MFSSHGSTGPQQQHKRDHTASNKENHRLVHQQNHRDAAKGSFLRSFSNAHNTHKSSSSTNNIQFCSPLSCSLHTNYQWEAFPPEECSVRSVRASSVLRDAFPIIWPQNKPFPQNNIWGTFGANESRYIFLCSVAFHVVLYQISRKSVFLTQSMNQTSRGTRRHISSAPEVCLCERCSKRFQVNSTNAIPVEIILFDCGHIWSNYFAKT